ncbi:MAG: TrkH family potassium uptake protein [Syntrophales bacterium]|nr:TrkH family potassium uptake protein [Syntrophales bacterium]
MILLEKHTSKFLTPQKIFILSFAVVILLGAFLLWLPISTAGRHISFIDALFTSASAVCVTGLTVLDIGKDLSLTGQIVTLCLFQIGGLGIITFSVVFFGLMGWGISLREREVVQSVFLPIPRRDIFSLVKWIFKVTFFLEILGTFLLFLRFSQDFPIFLAFYYALYHAVSAFNNCGFSLFSNSLMDYSGDVIVNLTVVLLIISGGLGFVVMYEIWSWMRGFRRKLSVHSKVVLLTTGCLVFLGGISFYIFEMNNTLKDTPVTTKILVSLFQSVTPRTCGFNTVDIGGLTNGAILLIVMLMFIGASPGSTGGGIKTTSFAILVLMVWNRLRGMDLVNVFNRTIPGEILTRTIAIIFASALSVIIVTSVLLLSSGIVDAPSPESRKLFVEYFFETVSAFGTVGLSMGITPKLSNVQKITIIFMMFAGRVGPLTLAFSWHKPKRGIMYAEENIMVG